MITMTMTCADCDLTLTGTTNYAHFTDEPNHGLCLSCAQQREKGTTMTEPSKNCVSITITRHHGKWIATMTYHVGPYTSTREAEGDTYEEAYTAVNQPQG